MFKVLAEVIEEEITFSLEGFNLITKGKDNESALNNFVMGIRSYANNYMDNIEYWNQEENYYEKFKIMLKVLVSNNSEIISNIVFI